LRDESKQVHENLIVVDEKDLVALPDVAVDHCLCPPHHRVCV
jgi:hypothetical protein